MTFHSRHIETKKSGSMHDQLDPGFLDFLDSMPQRISGPENANTTGNVVTTTSTALNSNARYISPPQPAMNVPNAMFHSPATSNYGSEENYFVIPERQEKKEWNHQNLSQKERRKIQIREASRRCRQKQKVNS